jgi:hypothetical protein
MHLNVLIIFFILFIDYNKTWKKIEFLRSNFIVLHAKLNTKKEKTKSTNNRTKY